MKKAILFLLREMISLRPHQETQIRELIKEIEADQAKQPKAKS